MKGLGALIFLGLVAFVACACNPPPTLPPGGRWVPDEGCSRGPNYQTLTAPRERCSCWGHCGYVCRPNNGGGGSPTTKPVTTTTKKASPCPYGGIWWNPQGQRCRCQTFNGQSFYVCETTTTAGTTSAADPTTTATSGA